MSHFTGPLLPDSAVPSAYDLRLDLDDVAGSFTGTVAVNVELRENTRFIVLNGVDLSVNKDGSSFKPREPSEVILHGGDLSANSTVLSSDTCEAEVKVIVVKYFGEKIILEFGSYLPKGEGLLQLKFNGLINKESNRLFICCGDDKKTCARRCFPCWDEPVYKARFKVTVQVPLGFGAVSNMPVFKEDVHGGGVKSVTFQESPSVPTYLVMFVGLLQPDLESKLNPESLLKSREMLTLQRELFSLYWTTTRQYSPLGVGTNQSGTRNDAKEILLGDIVMNRETERVSRVGREDDKLFLFPIDKAEREELRKDEVVVVSRPFFHGQPVCLVRDKRKLGIICGIDMKVDLASSDGKTIAHHDIGTELLERNRRFVVGDTVVCGSWFGIVQDVELTLEVRLEDNSKITAHLAEPESYEPIFKNAAETYLEEPYYVGQEVIDLVFDNPVRGIVLKHKVENVEVEWIHCSSLSEEEKPAKSIFYREVQRIHDYRSSRAFWALGSRCIFEGQEFVIAGVRSMVKVEWQGGFVEEISSTELMESKEFFSGQFVAKKEEEGMGFVRFVVNDIAWVKWEEKSELVPTSELQRHADYQFQVSDCVAEKYGSRARGFIVSMENGRLEVEWCLSKTITKVDPEEITRITCLFGEDTTSEEQGSSDDDKQPFVLAPVAITSTGSFLLEPASSSDEDSDEDD